MNLRAAFERRSHSANLKMKNNYDGNESPPWGESDSCPPLDLFRGVIDIGKYHPRMECQPRRFIPPKSRATPIDYPLWIAPNNHVTPSGRKNLSGEIQRIWKMFSMDLVTSKIMSFWSFPTI